MKFDNFIDGCKILQTYFEEPNGYHIGAGHDIFHVYATDRPVSDEDVVRLRELGWHQPDVDDTDDGESVPYDPAEGWGAFT
jgi:hypothetical protein